MRKGFPPAHRRKPRPCTRKRTPRFLQKQEKTGGKPSFAWKEGSPLASQKPNKHRLSATQWACRVFAAVLTVPAGLWLALKLTARKPAVLQPPVAAAPTRHPTIPEPEQDATSPGPQRKQDTWTFLLAAQDEASGSTDTIMVCTYDTAAQRAGLVSLPRDTLVVREGWKYCKLNGALPSGNKENPPDGGIRELRSAVSELLGIPMDHYILVNTEIFPSLVDEIGGVEFDVPVHMSYDDPDQGLHIHYEPGLQHLTGAQALDVVRCRKNSDGPGQYPHNLYDAYPDADIGRTRTQQAMVQTILKKALSKPQKVPAYLELFSQYVDTDLTLANLLWFVEPALGFNLDSLATATLPGDGTVTYQGVPYCYALDVEASLAIINDLLNPYTTSVTENMVKMVRVEE